MGRLVRELVRLSGICGLLLLVLQILHGSRGGRCVCGVGVLEVLDGRRCGVLDVLDGCWCGEVRRRGVLLSVVHGSRHGNLDVRRLATNDRIKAGVLVGGVLDDALETIRVDQLVAAGDGVAVARLLLRLDVAGMLVVHRVGELVVGGCLVLLHLHRDGTDSGDGQ